MRRAVLLLATCAALSARAAEPQAPPAEKVEALSDEELDALDAPVAADAGVRAVVAVARPSIATEHAFDRRLLALPALLIALLAWNVQWRPKSLTGRSR